MILNSIDISNFGASVNKKYIHPTTIDIEKVKIKSFFYQVSSKLYFKRINVKLLFEGKNRDVILNNVSNFMSKITNESDIKFKNLPHTYHVYLVTSEIEDTEFDDWLYLHLEFDGYEYGQQIVETMNRILTKTINVTGNVETPATLEITPSIDTIDLTLEGLTDEPIVIRNLKAGKKIVIKEGLTTEAGVNKFNDIDMWEFPLLHPGANTITVSKSNVDISIKYNPMYN